MTVGHYSIGAAGGRYWHGLVEGDVKNLSHGPPRHGEGRQSGASAQLLCYTYVALLVQFQLLESSIARHALS